MFLASATDGVWDGRLFADTLRDNYFFTGRTTPLSDTVVARLVRRLEQALRNIVNEMIRESELLRNAPYRDLYNDAITLLRAFYHAAIGRPMPIAGGKLHGGVYRGADIPNIVFLKAAMAALCELPDSDTVDTTPDPTQAGFKDVLKGLVELSHLVVTDVLPTVKSQGVYKFSDIPELNEPIFWDFRTLFEQISSLTHDGWDTNDIKRELFGILVDIRYGYISYRDMKEHLEATIELYNRRVSQSTNNDRRYNQSIHTILTGLLKLLNDFETLPQKKLEYIVRQEILEEDAIANAVDLSIERRNINATPAQREELQEQVAAVGNIRNILQNEAAQFALRAVDVVVNRNPLLQLAWGAYMYGSSAISSVVSSLILDGGKRSNTRKSKHISKHKTHKKHASHKTRRYKRYLNRSRKASNKKTK
jgi:hypothetical protein